MNRLLVVALKRVLVVSPSSEVGSVVDSDGSENSVSVAILDGLFDSEGGKELVLKSRLQESVNMKRKGPVKSHISMDKISTPRAKGFKLCGAQFAKRKHVSEDTRRQKRGWL